jgi:SAM-dependent methyltransferase
VVTSQREIWDNRYRERAAGFSPRDASDFAKRAASLLAASSDVLELGCGPGWDAAYFAGLGHRVLATDFSGSLIRGNVQRFEGTPGLSFAVLDTSQPFELAVASYDLVYARLSLHYFEDAATRRVFDEVARVLRPKGRLAFMCRSTSDPAYGKGVEIAGDVFEFGHVRHFFSEAYTHDVLAPRFFVDSLTLHDGLLYDSPSAWIEVVSRRR